MQSVWRSCIVCPYTFLRRPYPALFQQCLHWVKKPGINQCNAISEKIGETAQDDYRPSFRKKIRWDAGGVLEYLRTHDSAYLRGIKKQHLSSQDLGIKGLELLLQES